MKAIFDFFGESALGVGIRGSRYAFPVIEMVHLLGLGMLLGSILLLNVRFFGFGLKREKVSEVAEDLAPWTRLALIVMAISGVGLFASKAPDLWGDDRDGFYLKMTFIATATVFHYTVQLPLARKENLPAGKIAAAMSLMLWFGGALAGLSLEFL